MICECCAVRGSNKASGAKEYLPTITVTTVTLVNMKCQMNADNRCILLRANYHSIVLILFLSGPVNFSPDVETVLGTI